MNLLEVDQLSVAFHTREGIVRAVSELSYHIAPGESLGIVGESGSGKSVSQYAQLGLLPTPPARIESGRVIFEGKDLIRLSSGERRAVRGARIAMIFQDPMTALNPYMPIGRQLTEPLRVHGKADKKAARFAAIEMLERVGIQEAAMRMRAFPHEFSGGMRQRVMIAMALITRPALLIADEPTTALDVTVQAQILDLIRGIQQESGMALVLITHDLGVIAQACDRVLVMYAGRILESASAQDLFARPRHPYTRALMDSMPVMHCEGEQLFTIPGLPPDLIAPIRGCPFAARCAWTQPACEQPCRLEAVQGSHQSACIRVREGGLDLHGGRAAHV